MIRSLPVTADIGVGWPVLAAILEEGLGIGLEFVPAPQETPEGRAMREWIAGHIRPVDRAAMYQAAGRLRAPQG